MEYEIDEIWDYHILPPAQTCTIWHLYDIILVVTLQLLTPVNCQNNFTGAFEKVILHMIS